MAVDDYITKYNEDGVTLAHNMFSDWTIEERD
jgi:hypothetical protein